MNRRDALKLFGLSPALLAPSVAGQVVPDPEPVEDPGLPHDQRFILDFIDALGLTRDDAVRRLSLPVERGGDGLGPYRQPRALLI